MTRQRELNFSDAQLREMMSELKVTEKIDLKGLRAAFVIEIKQHHTDKGGELMKSQNLTHAYRVLKNYLEAGILLPTHKPSGFFASANVASSFSKSGCRRNYQAQRSAAAGFKFDEDFYDDFQTVGRKKNRNRGQKDQQQQEPNQSTSTAGNMNGSRSSNHKNRGRKPNGKNDSDDDADFATNGHARSQKTKKEVPKKFINGHKYDPDDYSNYDDPMDRNDRQKDNIRRIRGGLLLYADFHRHDHQQLPSEYEVLKNATEDDLIDDPAFSAIKERLAKIGEGLDVLANRLRAFVYVDWAFSGESDVNLLIKRVKLVQIEGEESLYHAHIPQKQFDDGLLSPGLHLDIRSSDKRHSATALIDRVDTEAQSIVLFFIDPYRLTPILANSHFVDIAINTSSFVFRSALRSIDFVFRFRHLQKIIYPTLEFSEDFDEFEAKRADLLPSFPFRESDRYNYEQKCAVYSILTKAHNPYPFVLFGPPGTGKTVTIVEAVRQIVLQSPQNRVLICTPSRMAADNCAECVLERSEIDPKYLFRMHSLSTVASGKDGRMSNARLKPISYLPKEAKGRFYGIPDRDNLKMFRVIICTLSTSSYLVSAGGLRGFFTHIFIDEAGQATEPDSWIPIGGLAGPSTSLIFSGDPKQLGPVVGLRVLQHFGYDTAMIKRLIFSEAYQNADDRAFITLKETYRSHYRILRPCSYLFYDSILRANEEDETILYKMAEWDGLPTKGFPIIFHSSSGSCDEMNPTKSYRNEFEADLVVNYVKRILEETDAREETVGVITPYKCQVYRIRHLLSEFAPGVCVDSVEGFQGSEREVIIMSTVRTSGIGFLRCDMRLNTSISRARSLLIVIGDDRCLSQHITWKKFIFYCNYHGGYLYPDGTKRLSPNEDEDDGQYQSYAVSH